MNTFRRVWALALLMCVPVGLALAAEGLASRPGPPEAPSPVFLAVA